MKTSKIILSLSAFVVAVAAAFVSYSTEMPAPFFGLNSSNQCVQGTIQETGCTLSSGTRCTVLVGTSTILDAWDSKLSDTECDVAIFRSTNP